MSFEFNTRDVSEELAEDLSVEDFRSCRQLIIENIKIMERNETVVVGAVSATIAFGLTKSNPFFAIHLAVIPAIVSLGLLRFWGLRDVIRLADAYTRDIELRLPVKWATHYGAKNSGVLGWSRYLFWGVLSLLLAFYIGFWVGAGPFRH